MSRMPGAIWDPLAADWNRQPRMRAHNFVCIHTMVGSLQGTDDLFRFRNGRGYDGTESHYGTGHDGRTEQWQDTTYQAEANLDGNGDVISIENADYGVGFPKWDTRVGSQVPAFTDAQVEAIAEILAWECSPAAHRDCPPNWACHQVGIPLELVPDTKPGRRGVAYHRQGIDPWRVLGGTRWSGSRGKECPAPRRIAQIPQIIARAKQITSGAPTPVIDPRGPEMRVLRVTENGRMYTATDTEVTYIPDPAIATSAQKTWGEAKEVSQREVDVLAFDANARRARHRREVVTEVVAQVSGVDIDEQALSQSLLAGLLPELTTALAAKTGATREDVEEVLRGVLGGLDKAA